MISLNLPTHLKPYSVGSFLLMILLLALQTLSVSANTSDLTKHTIQIGSTERNYFLHLPAHHVNQSKKVPLVIALHGGGKGDGKDLEKNIQWIPVAQREGFALALPNGVNGNWNDGRGITYKGTEVTQQNDVRFISQLIDQLVQTYPIDAQRIYVTGLSNGGMMTFRLGCEITGKIAAIAPVIANMPSNLANTCHPNATLPVLIMNGTKDPLMPYDGGDVTFFFKKMGKVLSAQASTDFWVTHNRCSPKADSQKRSNVEDRDRSHVIVNRYRNTDNTCDVRLYSIVGGGHTLPSSQIPNRPWLLGHKNLDIHGVEEIWAFFKLHSR